MYIVYRDELGNVIEKVDEYGIGVCGEYAYFNDKKIPLTSLTEIREDLD